MDTTPRLSLPYLAPAQAQKHVTHNAALALLDALVQGVVIAQRATPPATPQEGEAWLIDAQPSGDWAQQANALAQFLDGAWRHHAPHPGWRVWSMEARALLVFDGAAWTPLAEQIARLGVNAAPDAVNRLAVASEAALFTHEGAGHQVKVNKAGAGETASFVFQNAFSGRAEIGLVGDDDFRFKVSADGAVFRDAIVLDRATGRARFPGGGVREQLSAPRSYFVNASAGSDAHDGLSAGTAFATISRALDAVAAIDAGGKGVEIRLAPGAYAEFVFANRPVIGTDRLIVRGDPANPGAVTLGGGYHTLQVRGISLLLRDLTLSGGTGSLIFAERFADVELNNIVFGPCGRSHIEASGARVTFSGPQRINGAAGSHITAREGAQISGSNVTVTVDGAPNFPNFLRASSAAVVSFWNVGYQGAATGRRFEVTTNAIVQTEGPNQTDFPGDAAGVTATGGVYG